MQNVQQITRCAKMLSAMGTEPRLRIMHLVFLHTIVAIRRVPGLDDNPIENL
jgi:hypothetical protein